MKPTQLGVLLVVVGVFLTVLLNQGGFNVENATHDVQTAKPAAASLAKPPKRAAKRTPAPPADEGGGDKDSTGGDAAEENSSSDDHAKDPSNGKQRGNEAVANVGGAVAGDGRAIGDSVSYNKLVDGFVHDKSFKPRCAAPEVRTSPERCVPAQFETTATTPQLVGPKSKGDTTRGMATFPMEELLPRPSPDTIHRGPNGTVVHHPIFFTFAKKTFTGPLFADRVTEFNGVHAAAEYDCPADIDFRQYHQVRALLCETHEGFVERHQDTVEGMFPLVDEEYMEYAMTLTTAYEAAKLNRPYVFIELGARYGTWIVRAGASYRLFGGDVEKNMKLLAVEGNCEWFQKMGEHVACNHLETGTDLILAYAAPREYNKVRLSDSSTYKEPRAVSLLDMLPGYKFVDMIDFDIQGFEAMTVEEPGAIELMTEKIGFAHFGTHGADIEIRLLRLFQKHGWRVIYFFAGAHTKKLSHGHKCMTPFGPSLFNDGVLGFANPKYYPKLAEQEQHVVTVGKQRRGKGGKGLTTCYFAPEASQLLFRQLREEGGSEE